MFSIISHSQEFTKSIGRLIGELAKPGDVICMTGDLGAGKTSLTQGLAEGLQISDIVNSPTFNIIKEYQGALPLYHFDVYRLGDPGELEELGYEEYFYGQGVSVVEWSNLIEDYLPDSFLMITISHLGDNKREISLESVGKDWEDRVTELKNNVDTSN